MKYFIISGGSKGLGEGLAMELLDESHHLLIIARSESRELKKLAAAKACQMDFFSFDLGQTQAIPQLMAQVFGQVDEQRVEGVYLVNNAGLIEPVKRVEDCPPEMVDQHMRVNLLAPMLLSAAFIRQSRHLNTQKRILHISSGAAEFPYYGWSCYCTGKAGLEMFGRCISEEQRDQKYPVECMSVAPGIIDTAMQTTIRSSREEDFIHRQKFIDLKEGGQLIAPRVAGKKLARLLLSDAFNDGGRADIRDSY